MATQKKCENCGQWTIWNHQLNDTCKHCGQLLDKRTITELQNYEEQEKKRDEISFFVPKPGENPFISGFRRAAWLVHVIYMAIVSFILWLIAGLAG